MKKLVLLLFLTLFLGAQADETNNKLNKKDIKKDRKSNTGEILLYKTIGEHQLALHLFKPKNWAKTDKRPAIIFFFGGGWVGGKPQQFFKIAEHFSSLGFVCASVQYRTKRPHGTTPFECVKDGKSAVRYFRSHALELGIDPNKIIASGGSAGGHVACSTALIRDYDETVEDISVSSTPNALILFNPVLDTTEKGYGAEKLKGKETLLSPCHHVRPSLPPTIVFTGTADKITPLENAERFTRLMKEVKNDCTLIPIDGKGHGVSSAGKQGKDSYDTCISESLKFLKSHDFIPKQLKSKGIKYETNTPHSIDSIFIFQSTCR
jgi:acetyl esterase